MIALLDVNLLVALAWPNHIHHDRAHAWLTMQREHGWASCPLTQSGFVRVSSNRRAMPTAVTPVEARTILRRIVALPQHTFWVDDISFAGTDLVDDAKLVGYRQVTDAHLLAIARRHGGCLATLDSGIRDLAPPGMEATVCVVR